MYVIYNDHLIVNLLQNTQSERITVKDQTTKFTTQLSIKQSIIYLLYNTSTNRSLQPKKFTWARRDRQSAYDSL